MNNKENADLIVHNATIMTVDSAARVVEAMAILDGKIAGIGSREEIYARFTSDSSADLGGKYILPGFIDPHSHFLGYAMFLQYVDLFGASSFDEVIRRIRERKVQSGEWLIGRGWDQNLWKEKEFPDNKVLNTLFPEIPVMLIRVDGHVVLANQAALDQAGIGPVNEFGNDQVLKKNGILTGILSENAADRMRAAVPAPRGELLLELLRKAQEHCFETGLTTVCDAGLDAEKVMYFDSLQKKELLKMQLYVMLNPSSENFEKFVKQGPYLTERLTVRSVKIYADGSLGSRTARLKKPYTDAHDLTGVNVTPDDSIRTVCEIAYKHGYQVNVHCIGDEAVHKVLTIFSTFLKGKNDLRWRIEHAQVVDPADFHLFGDFSIIPSVQATHATSDMNWADERLGPDRLKGAYAYKRLMQENGWIPNGTDFPIEQISPFLTFYAAVSRQDISGAPEGGFQPANALTREEALRSITIWAAKANFMEKTKGSLEEGKDADFIVLDQDLMESPINEVPRIKVLKTFIRGTCVFDRESAE